MSGSLLYVRIKILVWHSGFNWNRLPWLLLLEFIICDTLVKVFFGLCMCVRQLAEVTLPGAWTERLAKTLMLLYINSYYLNLMYTLTEYCIYHHVVQDTTFSCEDNIWITVTFSAVISSTGRRQHYCGIFMLIVNCNFHTMFFSFSKVTAIVTFLCFSQYALCLCTGTAFHFCEVSCISCNLVKHKDCLQFTNCTCVLQCVSDMPFIRKCWCDQLMERFSIEG